MKRLLTILCLLAAACSGPERNYTHLVDPLIGSGGHGHVFVGASVPHGMVQAGPNNLSKGWDWCSGYHASDTTIVGFAQTHLSGTGIADLGDVVLMPVTGRPGMAQEEFFSPFLKRDELARPGYYSVLLARYGIRAELTVTERVALHRYTYPAGETCRVIVDLEEAPKSLARKGCTDAWIKVVNDSTVVGFRASDEWAADHRVWFALRFSQPLRTAELYASGRLCAADSLRGDRIKACLAFGRTPQLLVRAAVSYTSLDGALSNLLNSPPRSWDFDGVRKAADRSWNEYLAAIEFESRDEEVLRIFYTSLYHTGIAPALYSDAGAPEEYSVFSLWDTYRAVHPLYTIMDRRTPAYVRSLLALRQRQGRMPVWSLAGCETDCMVGVHSIPVVVDAALKGVAGVDPDAVWQAVRDFDRYDARGLKQVREQGWIAADREPWSVAKGLEYCVDDAAIARMAAHVGDTAAQAKYTSRARGYRHYFDPATRFMRGRLADGTFRTPFDPAHSLHLEDDYVEGNAWQYTWLVPCDHTGLIELFGGREPFLEKLDSLFAADPTLNEGASADITGLIGQYAHGNEPSHHILYLYAAAGRHARTAELVRRVCREFYTTRPDGLIGNEDCGQMSAWYLFTALGFYPLDPVGGRFVLGSPLADRAVIHTLSGRDFVVRTENNSPQNKYILSATLDGEPYDRCWIDYERIMCGGELLLRMGPEPNGEFGRDGVPVWEPENY